MSALIRGSVHTVTVTPPRRSSIALPLFVALFLAGAVPATAVAQAQQKSSAASTAAIQSDPLLKALHEELERNKSQLKMENVPAPYYIEYRLSDVDEYTAEAAFGALRQDQRIHGRSLRVVVRVGDYKLDSYYGPGTGVVTFAPRDDDSIALRRELWLATDRAYKIANEALASKKAVLSQYSADQPFDDFARAPALESYGPLVKLDFSPAPWKETLEKVTRLYRSDAKIQSLSAYVRFRAVNDYFVNTEGSSTARAMPSIRLTSPPKRRRPTAWNSAARLSTSVPQPPNCPRRKSCSPTPPRCFKPSKISAKLPRSKKIIAAPFFSRATPPATSSTA